jgi:lipid II isoglutaminyl synthase (glutamine-hydrolysing)
MLKILIFLLRKFTSYSATALPGLILEKFFPSRLRKFLGQFDKVILITGTNGKTTTSRLIGHLLKENSINYVSNSSGSNLIRGIAS